MTGLALDLLKKKEGIDLRKNSKDPWPFLSSLEEMGCLSKIDVFFAKRLLSPFEHSCEEEALLLAALLAFSREGHLCIRFEEEKIFPSLLTLGFSEEQKNILEKKLMQGLQNLPKELVNDVSIIPTNFKKPLCRFSNHLYLQRNWIFETRFLHHVGRLLQASKKPLSYSQENGSLTGEQAAAVRMALDNNLSLITGGPGTGKTYTAAHIVSTFVAGAKDCRVLLTAPTGKAAAHLEASLKRLLNKEINYTCGTLHSLLKVKSTSDCYKEGTSLMADLIIVDECSMIDARLFSYFLSSVGDATKVILMGDRDQLPPVDSGSFFADLLELGIKGYPIPYQSLNQSLRSDQKEILSLSDAIQRGDIKEIKDKILSQKGAVMRIDLGFSSANASLVYARLWERTKEHFLKPYIKEKNPLELLESLKDFRILSCMRKGSFGVDALNASILQNLKKELLDKQQLIAPILILRNDYSLGLFNGDMGLLIRQNRGKASNESGFTNEDCAIFFDKEKKDGYRSFSAPLLPAFEYAFCLSVHKSQGSEYSKILLLAPNGSEVFGKEVLYTAVTRARTAIEIDCSDAVIEMAMQRDSRKISGLQARVEFKS